MNKVELLAPAGKMESVIAAVQNGADAIYLGGSKFSARAFASNFDYDEMIKAVDYCHLYGVKVYVTLNILLKNSELNEAMTYCQFLYNIGVDAVIVQDTGLLYMLNKYLPELRIHASTQMTIHNSEGVKLLSDFGLKKIVLSRELSLKEIEYIVNKTDDEIEVFVHGALCICYSGQCLMSSIIGGRSGNRGRCAQPCRLPYTMINTENGKERNGYLLSPKDICTVRNVKELIESGAKSFKIEGRMKRPEYVAGVVNIYRNAIDSVYNNSEFDYDKAEKELAQLFNREGFSKAYLFGNTGQDMMAFSNPKNTGIEVGKVIDKNLIKLTGDLSVKDGIRIKDKGFTVTKIFRNNEEIKEAYSADKVKILPIKYKKGDILYKTADNKLLSVLGETYRNSFNKKINIDATLSFELNKPICLKTIYRGKEFEILGEVVQKAINKPLEKDRIIKSLMKTGDSPFKIQNIEIENYEEGFLSVSSVNNVRRELFDKIQEYTINSYKNNISLKVDGATVNNEIENSDKNLPNCLICINNKEQLRAVMDAEINDIAIDIFDKKCDIKIEDILEIENLNVLLKIPNVLKDAEFNEVCDIINENLNKINGILTGNLGIINKFNTKTKILGDYKLNVFNNSSLKFFNNLLDGVYLSTELNRREIKEIISNNFDLPCGIIVYGRYELMVSEYCPIGSTFGGKNQNRNCRGECLKGNYVLKDRMNKEFILKTDKYCRSHVYNSLPTNLINDISGFKKDKIKNHRIDFINENYEEVIDILNSYKNKKFDGKPEEYTRGHLRRGVE